MRDWRLVVAVVSVSVAVIFGFLWQRSRSQAQAAEASDHAQILQAQAAAQEEHDRNATLQDSLQHMARTLRTFTTKKPDGTTQTVTEDIFAPSLPSLPAPVLPSPAAVVNPYVGGNAASPSGYRYRVGLSAWLAPGLLAGPDVAWRPWPGAPVWFGAGVGLSLSTGLPRAGRVGADLEF